VSAEEDIADAVRSISAKEGVLNLDLFQESYYSAHVRSVQQVFVHTHTHTHTHTCVCVHTNIHMYVCMCKQSARVLIMQTITNEYSCVHNISRSLTQPSFSFLSHTLTLSPTLGFGRSFLRPLLSSTAMEGFRQTQTFFESIMYACIIISIVWMQPCVYEQRDD